jgi:microcystin-dependent protein
MGQGPGLDNRVIGGTVGTATVTVDSAQMPAHNHPVIAVDSPSDAYTPVGNVPGLAARSVYAHATTTTAAPTAIGNAGGGQPHNNMQPYLCLNYVIALQGIYPPRS